MAHDQVGTSSDAEPRAIEDTIQGASIHVRGLSKEFETENGAETVFEDLNFDIDSGSFTTLLGVSGSGKSTLLNILSGIMEPTSGTIEYQTQDGSESIIGHVFQSPRLLPWKSSIENLGFVHENNQDYSPELAKRYLDLVGLSDHYEKYPSQLSGGQKQRIGIARALSIDPDVLLMDEPFSNLDEITAEELREELLRIWRKLDKTVVFVTHDINEAVELADRILMLGKGQIYADIEVPLDRPRELDSEEFLKFRQEAIERFHDRPE